MFHGTPRDLALLVECPHCWARQGEPCVSKKNGRVRSAIHADRYLLADRLKALWVKSRDGWSVRA